MHTSIHKLNTITGERMKQLVKFVQSTRQDKTLSHNLSPMSAICSFCLGRQLDTPQEHILNRDDVEESWILSVDNILSPPICL